MCLIRGTSPPYLVLVSGLDFQFVLRYFHLTLIPEFLDGCLQPRVQQVAKVHTLHRGLLQLGMEAGDFLWGGERVDCCHTTTTVSPFHLHTPSPNTLPHHSPPYTLHTLPTHTHYTHSLHTLPHSLYTLTTHGHYTHSLHTLTIHTPYIPYCTHSHLLIHLLPEGELFLEALNVVLEVHFTECLCLHTLSH